MSVSQDANSKSVPSMSDQKELQSHNQELIRQNRRLERELKKKREGACRLLGIAKSTRGRSSNAAVAERFREAVARKKAQSPLATKRGDLIATEDRNRAINFLNEGAKVGLRMKAIADLLGVCRHMLRRWRLDISGRELILSHHARKRAAKSSRQDPSSP